MRCDFIRVDLQAPVKRDHELSVTTSFSSVSLYSSHTFIFNERSLHLNRIQLLNDLCFLPSTLKQTCQ